MSKIIRDISIDIKEKIEEATLDIYRAIEKKEKNPRLSERYYESSKDNLQDINKLHDKVVEEIDIEREKSEPPSIMLKIWDYEHKSIIEDVEAIKALQEYYISL